MKKLFVSFFALSFIILFAYGEEIDDVDMEIQLGLRELNNTVQSNQDILLERISQIDSFLETESNQLKEIESSVKQGNQDIISTIKDHSNDAIVYGFVAIGIAILALIITLIFSKKNVSDLKTFIMRNRYLQDANTSFTGKFFESAKSFYDKAIDLDPKDTSSLLMAGNSLSTINRDKEAIEYYDRILEINSKDYRALNNKGVSLGKLGKHQEAISFYTKAISIKPDFVDALNNLGVEMREKKNYSESIKFYKTRLI